MSIERFLIATKPKVSDGNGNNTINIPADLSKSNSERHSQARGADEPSSALWEIEVLDNLTSCSLAESKDSNIAAQDVVVFDFDNVDQNDNSIVSWNANVTAMSLGSDHEASGKELMLDVTAMSIQSETEKNNKSIINPSQEVLLPEATTTAKVKPRKIYRQKFKYEWADDFPWIEKSGTEVSCKICKIMVSGGAFHLRRHEKTTKHLQNSKARVHTQKLEKVASAMNRRLVSKLLTTETEWKFVCYMCAHNLSFRLMDTLPSFCAKTFLDSSLAKSVKMKRKKATQIVVGILAPYAKEILVRTLRQKSFSLIIDETTDVSTKKSLVVIARFWENDRVSDRFLDLIEVENATAEGIISCLKQILDENGIPYHNIIGFAADNASVMMGNRSSVRTKLTGIAPNIVIQGCSCHSFHLCASHACSKLPGTVEQFARDIYSYFSNSSKRLQELHECQIFVDEKPHKMLYPSQTRWLSLEMVINRILEHWNSLTLFFQRAALADKLPNASALLNALRNPIYKVYFMFLSYVTGLLTRINIEFQAESPKLPQILEKVSGLYKIILKAFVKKSVMDVTAFEKISVADPANFRPLEDTYYRAKVDAFLKCSEQQVDKRDLHSFRVHALEYYIELCKQIKKRFNFCCPHLRFASNFTVHNALSGSIESIAEYMNLYPTLQADIEQVNLEWQQLPEAFPLSEYNRYDILEFWKLVNGTKNAADNYCFENLMIVVRYVLSLPHSSAAAERAFSQLSLIKSKLRNKLFVTTCCAILMVKDSIKSNVIGYDNLPVRDILDSLQARSKTDGSRQIASQDVSKDVDDFIGQVNVTEDVFIVDEDF